MKTAIGNSSQSHDDLEASHKKTGRTKWKDRKHGANKRRTWRKFHVGIDPKTGEIVAQELTGNDTHDAEPVERTCRGHVQPGERAD